MINTVAELLLRIKRKEEEQIKKFEKDVVNIKHPTIVGDMYEGIAQNLLEKSIFKEFDVRVVSGQIINKKKELSPQIDCMIVEGEGKEIPHTNDWIYDISQVIAVIEVKKNLNKGDLTDAYKKMIKIQDMWDPRDMTHGEFNLFRDAFRNAVGIDVPDHNKISNYDLVTEMMYHNLLMETMLPLRIVFGFYGYKDIKSLRKGFIRHLKENNTSDINNPIKGFGPGSFPNLIFTRNSSLIKVNGIPYQPHVDEEGFWNIYVSSSHNPLFHLLEMLWTKLSYKHGIPSDIFGEDLHIEGHSRFLKGRPLIKEGKTAWEFTSIKVPDNLVNEGSVFMDWEPAELSGAEHLLMVWLCNEESINTNSEVFQNLLQQHNLDELEFLGGLKAKKLVYKDPNNELKLLTDECLVVIKAGKFYAGENRDGRMNRWLWK